MNLETLAEKYVNFKNKTRPIGRDLSQQTAIHLANCVRSYSRWLKRDAVADDFAPQKVNEYLAAIVAAGKSPYTAKNRRTGLLILMRFARRKRLIKFNAKRVRPIACPQLDIQGYRPEQVQHFVNYVSGLKWNIRETSIPKSVFWSSLILTQWRICLRIGDFSRVKVSEFRPDGWLWAWENKTHKRTWLQLSPAAAKAVADCIAADPGRELIWPGLNPESLSRAFTRLARAAGLPGSSQWIRRGASSQVEARTPGAGWKALRHSSPTVFERHYRIDDVCDTGIPSPPDIDLPPRLTG